MFHFYQYILTTRAHMLFWQIPSAHRKYPLHEYPYNTLAFIHSYFLAFDGFATLSFPQWQCFHFFLMPEIKSPLFIHA